MSIYLFDTNVVSELRPHRRPYDSPEEPRFVKAVTQGLADIREGNTVTLSEARKILDIA